jgi:adenylate cyclase
VSSYSRLTVVGEERKARILLARRKVQDAMFEPFGGRIVNTTGDSLTAPFVSSVETVNAALGVPGALSTQKLTLLPKRAV